MSEVAGRMAIQAGAYNLEITQLMAADIEEEVRRKEEQEQKENEQAYEQHANIKNAEVPPPQNVEATAVRQRRVVSRSFNDRCHQNLPCNRMNTPLVVKSYST